MTKKNSSLVAVQTSLAKLASSLRAAKLKTNDPEKIKAINHELIEINHRITMTGALIFHEQTVAITAAAAKVESAKKHIEEEIKKLDKIKKFVEAISGFLGLVDKVIDLAKTAVP